MSIGRGYIVGAGAQGRIIAEIWCAQEPRIQLEFLDDDPKLHGTTVDGIRVATVHTLETIDRTGARVVVPIGDNRVRMKLVERLSALAPNWATVVHPSAVIMPSARLGNGAVVFPRAVVNSGARIGDHVIVNTGAIVEHDAVLEDFCAFGPGACMGGRVHIECGAFISTGVTIAPRIRIGAGTIVGAGAVVVSDLPPDVLAYGVPARVIRPIDDAFDFARLL